MAGCAGFGAVLPALLGLASDSPKEAPQLSERLLVVCGSVNPISVAQMAAAEAAGVARWQMTPEQKLQPDYWRTEKGQAEFAAIREGVARNNPYIIDTNDKERNRLTDEYAASHASTSTASAWGSPSPSATWWGTSSPIPAWAPCSSPAGTPCSSAWSRWGSGRWSRCGS